MSFRKSVEYFFLVAISSKFNSESARSLWHQVTVQSSKKNVFFARSLLQCCSIGIASRQGRLSTGAGLRPFPSHSMRSMCPEPGRPWTTSPSPWTAGTACGCTLAAHRLGRVAHRRPTTGGTPPEPPAALCAAQLFETSQKPENRQGLGVGHGQPQAVAHPRHRRTRARNPSGWMTEAAGARCAKARQGAQPWGSGGASPLPGSALGAAGTAQAKRAGGPWTPPSGGLFTPKGRTTLRSNV